MTLTDSQYKTLLDAQAICRQLGDMKAAITLEELIDYMADDTEGEADKPF